MKTFTARTISNRFIQRFQAPPDRVFPLLCPVREHEWIEPWQCEMLHSDSGVAEKDCVFRTNPPGEPSDVWIVSHYEPISKIEFVRVNSIRTMRLTISLTDNGDGTTRAENDQLLVSLNEEGNQSLDAIAAGFAFEMRMGEEMMNHYLTSGQRLPLQDAIANASHRT